MAQEAVEGTVNAARDSIVLTQDAIDETAGGVAAFKVETASATYFLEKAGGGLSSLIDADGDDWINFHPEKGSGAGGEYRGFPNAVHKQAGSHFHPKNYGTDPTVTRVEFVSANYVSLVAQSESGHWACRYEFYPTHCTFSITRMPQENRYWVLYEGTPGGKLDLDDWWMTSAQSEAQTMEQEHETDIPDSEWIAFGDAAGSRSLVLFHHEDDDHPDTFYQMNDKMTVFGFGRRKIEKFQTNVGEHFSIGLVNSQQHADLSHFVEDVLAQATSPSATVSEIRSGIDLWYGSRQQFGHNGVPQRWINVLGRVSPAEGAQLSYSLNDADPQPLTIGPNRTRLARLGDFNVELDKDLLKPGINQLKITAHYATGTSESKAVEVDWQPNDSPDMPLTVDWQASDSIQDIAQVVDGLWKLTPQGVRVVEPYYDRVLAIGDLSWKNYEVTVPVTFHGFLRPGPTDGGRNVIHAAIAVRWPGHDDRKDNPQPRIKWYPLGATAEFMLQEYPEKSRWRILGGGGKKAVEESSRHIELNQQYMLKHRVYSPDKKRTVYAVKFWDPREPEPEAWNVQAEEEDDVPTGGALILAHYSDVTFGNVTVVPVHVP